MRPPFAYFGGKTRIAGRIVELLPEHEHYVEPFAGSLAVLLAKAPVKLETVNDLDQQLVTFWRVLRDRPVELARHCALTPHSRAEHQAAYDLDVEDELERARRVWVLLTQGRTGTLRSTGWRLFASPRGPSSPMPVYLDAYVRRMIEAAERLRGVSLECRPALEVIAAYGNQPRALLYVDPPYPRAVRAHRGYRLDMMADPAHAELLDALLHCTSAVVLSGYRCELYDRALAGWERIEIPATTTTSGEALAPRCSGRTVRCTRAGSTGSRRLTPMSPTAPRTATGWYMLAAFVATIPLANWTLEHVGFVDVPGLGPVASGVVWLGLAFVLRDVAQRALGRWAILAGIAAGVILSWWLATPELATASAVAFGAGELIDWAIFTRLVDRRGFLAAVLASSIAGALVDSPLFLHVAFDSTTGWWQLAVVKVATILVAAAIVAGDDRPR